MELKNTSKYLDALKDLHNILQYTNKISLSNFVRKHKISQHTPFVLKSGGVLRATGKWKGASYFWNTIEPNEYMANELIKKIKKHTSEIYQEQIEKQKITKKESDVIPEEKKIGFKTIGTGKDMPTVNPSPLKNSILKYTETKYLFGLVSIKTTYHY